MRAGCACTRLCSTRGTRGLQSEGIPDPDAEVGHCVHSLAMHPSRPDVLYMQKHWDVMRTDDAGDTWHDIGGNLPTAPAPGL